MKTYDLNSEGLWRGPEVVGTQYRIKTLKKVFRSLDMEDHVAKQFTVELVPEPDNPYSESGHAISVRWNGDTIGYIAESEVDKYQQIKRLTASGTKVLCKARIWAHTYKDGGRKYWVSLFIGDPEQSIPLNDPPNGDWALLPSRRSAKVSKTDEHMDYLQDFLPPSGHGLLLVTLHPFEAGVKKKYTGIEIHLDGERVGELTKASAEKVAPIVQLWEENGYATAARAYIQGSSLAIDLKLQYTPASEMSEEDLDPELCPIPKLVPFEPDPDDYAVPDAWSDNAKQERRRSAQKRMTIQEGTEVPGGTSREAPGEASWGKEAAEDYRETTDYLHDVPHQNSIGNHNNDLTTGGSSSLCFEPSPYSLPTTRATAHTHHTPRQPPRTFGFVKVLKYVLAGLSAVSGTPFFLYGLLASDPAGILFSVPLILPPAWFAYHELKEKSGSPGKRHWWVIALTCLIAFVAFLALLPTTP